MPGPFPLRAYDRPAISLANLAQGNLDAATRAIFAPMTLSPEELKTMRSRVLKGKGAQNVLLRSAAEMATNPLMLLGLVLTFGPWGKVASPSQLYKMMRAGGPETPAPLGPIGVWMSAKVAMRNLWTKTAKGGTMGLGTLWAELGKKIAEFGSKYTLKYQKIFADLNKELGRKATKKDLYLLDCYVRDFHKTTGPLQKDFGEAFFNMKIPLMPGLDKKIHPAIKKAGDAIKRFFGEAGIETKITEITKVGKNVRSDMAEKGVTGGGYATRLTGRSPIEKWLYDTRQAVQEAQERVMQRIALHGRSQFAKARAGRSLPIQSEIETIQEYFHPEQWERFKAIVPHDVRDARVALETTAKIIQERAAKGGGLPRAAVETTKGLELTPFGKKIFEEITRGEKGVKRMMKRLGEPTRVINKMYNELEAAALHSPEKLEATITAMSRHIGAPARFTIRPDIYMPEYVRSMSTTYAWHTTGYGEQMNNIVQKWGTPWQKRMWNTELMGMIRGMKHPKESARALLFQDTAAKFHDLLHTKVVEKLMPKNLRLKLIGVFSGEQGYIDDRTIGGKIASLLYGSALGLNMSPVSKNLFQPFIITLNVVGPEPMRRGLIRVSGGLKRAVADAVKESSKLGWKEAWESAFKKEFADYVREFPLEHISEAMAAGDIMKESKIAGSMAKDIARGAYEKVMKVFMAGFSGSEKWNRLLTFYSGQAAGLRDGLSLSGANMVGRTLNEMNNFTGGVAGIPGRLRGAWAPFRQFMHFPLRFSEWMYQSLRMGPDPTSISTGILGRTIIGSTAAYTLAKNLGVDISAGLAFSALPYPEYEQSPFYPFPLVPPAVSIGGEIVRAVATGDYKGVPGKVGAMLVPGGLASRRMWRTWAPKYADWKTRTPDGRVPVYNDKGMLINSQTPFQLFMRGLGIRPSGPQAEQDLVRYLLSQRDEIRQRRRDYLEALMDNDLEKARKVNESFEKKYPGLGPIKVKKSDIRAVRNRKTISRLDRILKGFPKEYRPLFQAMIEQSQLTELAQTINQSPDSLEMYLD